MNDYRYIIFENFCRDEFIYKAEEKKRKLRKLYKEVDVIVTHIPLICADCVFNEEEQEVYRAFYAFDGEKLVEETRAKLWVFGHTHKKLKLLYAEVLLLSNSLGYALP